MKKRMSKETRETLENMALPPEFIKPHICPTHDHSVSNCLECFDLQRKTLEWNEKKIIKVEKVVYRVPLWYRIMDIIVFACLAALAFHFYSRPPIDKPYPVYRTVYIPDQLCQPKLTACQSDWKQDQIIKKFLRAKIKSLELP